MPRSPARRRTTVPAAVPAAALVAASLAGCGGAEPLPRATVTVTVSPTRTVEVRGAEPAGRGIEGRRHDVGTIHGSDRRSGRLVLLLDRWTVRGMPDEVLADEGAPPVPEEGGRFVNNTDDKFYEVPVSPDVRVVDTSCVPSKTPGMMPGTRSVPTTMDAFLATKDRENQVVLLGYTTGLLVTLETSPHCPKGSIPRTPPPPASPSPAPTGTPTTPPPGR